MVPEASVSDSSVDGVTRVTAEDDEDDRTRPEMLVRAAVWSVLVAFAILRKLFWWQASAVAFLIYLFTGGWRYVCIRLKTMPRDFRAGQRYVELQLHMRKCHHNNATVPSEFVERTRRHPNKACFIFEDRTWTYREVDEYSNQVANVFANAGYKKGDVVALFMESCPEYVSIWLGLSKLGICTALINTNLRQKPFINSVEISKATVLIYEKELADVVQNVQVSRALESLKYYCVGDCDENDVNAQSLTKVLQRTSCLPPPRVQLNIRDKLLYIYTSGTTGLPKPAIISHSRYIFASTAGTMMFPLQSDDILYTPLPLYHTAGGVLGVGQAILWGNTVVIRKRFSASKYWDDCIKHDCTVAQYIGEICRYLLVQPEKPTDKQHKIRIMFGNGLRPQIWTQFVNRFNVEIREIYGSTEGNANIVNTDNKPNAIGFVSMSPLAKLVYPVMLIQVDEFTNEPVRGKDGLCIRCKPGEPGEFVGKIQNSDPGREFLGYVGKAATEKKIIGDVFKKGDLAFRSGDLLVMDELGYLYFKDRLGDTFRWKGENVSTSEVEGVIIDIVGLKECVVYGVEVPECEGRAGMAAIVDPEESIDLNVLADNVIKSLAVYARPLFLRIVKELDKTGTYKLRKIDLQKQGINPNTIDKDKLFYLDLTLGRYQPLNQRAYEIICAGKIRF